MGYSWVGYFTASSESELVIISHVVHVFDDRWFRLNLVGWPMWWNLLRSWCTTVLMSVKDGGTKFAWSLHLIQSMTLILNYCECENNSSLNVVLFIYMDFHKMRHFCQVCYLLPTHPDSLSAFLFLVSVCRNYLLRTFLLCCFSVFYQRAGATNSQIRHCILSFCVVSVSSSKGAGGTNSKSDIPGRKESKGSSPSTSTSSQLGASDTFFSGLCFPPGITVPLQAGFYHNEK